MTKTTIKKGAFINYDGFVTVKNYLETNGFVIASYKETATNGVYTLLDGTQISTNGYVYTEKGGK